MIKILTAVTVTAALWALREWAYPLHEDQKTRDVALTTLQKCPSMPGIHSSSSPFYCTQKERLEYINASEFRGLLIIFQEVLHGNTTARFIFPKEDLPKVTPIATEIRDQYTHSSGCKDTIWDRRFPNHTTRPLFNSNGTLVHYRVYSKGDFCVENSCIPEAIADLHLLQYVEECSLGTIPLGKFFPTLMEHERKDRILKRLNGVNISQVFDDSKTIILKGRRLKLGEIANLYRNLTEQYKKPELAVTSREFIEFISGLVTVFLELIQS